MAAPRLDAPASEDAPHPDSPWWGVHAARYRLAAQTLPAQRVLDVACGTGYGLGMLADGRRTVVGVDVERSALREASSAGPVVAAEATALPFPDGVFDAVTTFETIEHLEPRAAFLAELARVLAVGGRLVLSTPNALMTKPVSGRPRNPFHVYEYTPEELNAELELHFDEVRVLGQKVSPRFAVSPFYEDQELLVKTIGNRLRLLAWRVLNKLPARLRDQMSRRLWGHALYPGEEDYVFTSESVAASLTLLVTARARGGK